MKDEKKDQNLLKDEDLEQVNGGFLGGTRKEIDTIERVEIIE